MTIYPRPYLTPAIELPRWIPSCTIALPCSSREAVKQRLAAWNRGKYRVVCKAWSRHAIVVVPRAWLPLARAALWIRMHRHDLKEAAIRIGLYRSPTEGDWYANYRFAPCDLWGPAPYAWEAKLMAQADIWPWWPSR